MGILVKMATGALFGSGTARSTSKNLVEFRAGKMYMKGKMVHPDKRKGLLYVYQSDDSLMHFCWKDRTKGSVEDDLIIFPDDIEFKRVSQCTTGRVFLLRFKTSNRKFFFWMQEPKTDKDEEHCKKVNDSLNNPPTPGSSRGGSGNTGGSGFGGLPPELAASLGEGDLQNLLQNMSEQQLNHQLHRDLLRVRLLPHQQLRPLLHQVPQPLGPQLLEVQVAFSLVTCRTFCLDLVERLELAPQKKILIYLVR